MAKEWRNIPFLVIQRTFVAEMIEEIVGQVRHFAPLLVPENQIDPQVKVSEKKLETFLIFN